MGRDSETERLFSLPLSEFTAARNALAKRLRAAGEREAAAQIQRIRKPSVSAWVVNQLHHSNRAATDRLLDLGEEQRQAIRASRGVGDLGREKSDLMAGLLRASQGILAGSGSKLTPALRAKISRNLEALAALPADEASERAGRLTQDLEPLGFDAVLSSVTMAPPGRRSKRKAPAAGTQRKRTQAKQAVTGFEEDLKAARKLRGQTARRLKRLEARAERSRRDALTAQRKADAARQEADDLELATREARSELESASSSVERSDARLVSARDRLNRLS